MKILLLSLLLFPLAYAAMAQQSPAAPQKREFTTQEGDTTYVMKQYFLCLLKAGPNRSQPAAEAQQIQEGHMAHMSRLAKEGKLHLAGPMGDEGELRGIVVLDVETLEEAQRLQAQDPAVKAGRLIAEIHPWWAAKGSKLR